MWNFEKNRNEKITSYLENLVKKDGYPLEKYSVSTTDGYINVVYRIPHPRDEKNINKKRPAVILHHGLICSCAVFIDQNPLAYYLADKGFDVWLPNNRGTTFSRKHKLYDAEKDYDYWKFSLDEIALYDLTSFIDFVLEKTGEKQICIIGFSQGVTTTAMLLSGIPEYNEKINLNIFLGCPIIFDNITFFPVMMVIYFFLFLIMLVEAITRRKLCELPLLKEIRFIESFGARDTIWRFILRLFSPFVVGHRDHIQLEHLDYQRMSCTTPSTSSKRQFYHYSQMIRNARFSRYDYGTVRNMKMYGSESPPLYDLSKVKAPVAIFYGKNDMYNNYKKDKLEEYLGNVVNIHVIDHDLYNHLDFIFAKDNINLVYRHVVDLMNMYCV